MKSAVGKPALRALRVLVLIAQVLAAPALAAPVKAGHLQAELVASGIDIGNRDRVPDEAAAADGEGRDERGDQQIDGEPLPTMDEALGTEEAAGGEANGASA